MSDKTADNFEESQAPIMAHLVELRQRLIWVMVAIFVAFMVCFYYAADLYIFLTEPYKVSLMKYAANQDVTVKAAEFIITAPQELFIVYVRVALFGAIFLAFPIIAGQLYRFIAPGLYKNERESFYPFLIAAPILFVLGGALVHYVAMPLALYFFMNLQINVPGFKVTMVPRAREYLDLVTLLIMAFGISFQLPLVLTLLAKAGVITAEDLEGKRKYAFLGIAVFAAFLTPPDPLSLVALIVPTYLLYEVAILAVRYMEQKEEKTDTKQ